MTQLRRVFKRLVVTLHSNYWANGFLRIWRNTRKKKTKACIQNKKVWKKGAYTWFADKELKFANTQSFQREVKYIFQNTLRNINTFALVEEESHEQSCVTQRSAEDLFVFNTARSPWVSCLMLYQLCRHQHAHTHTHIQWVWSSVAMKSSVLLKLSLDSSRYIITALKS